MADAQLCIFRSLNITGTYGDTTENYDDYYDDTNDRHHGLCVYELHGARFLPVLYSLFFVLGSLGNSLVLWVILMGVRLRSMTDVCLLNLAISDLLLLCSLPFLAHHVRDQWVFGDFMCKAVLSAYHVGFYSGIFFVTLMSVDRYLAIVHAVSAMRARTRTCGVVASIMIWVAGLLASFPEVLYLKTRTHSNTTFCGPDYIESRQMWNIFGYFKMNTLGLLIPIAIMGFCYTNIIIRLLSTVSSKKQAIRLVLMVSVVFFCCWTPYNVAAFFKALELCDIYSSCATSKAIRVALQATEAIAYFHCCLNPIIYVFVGQKFRRHLRRLLNRAPCSVCQLNKIYLRQVRDTGSDNSQTTSVNERSTAM